MIAVGDIDRIFDLPRRGVAFASDHSTIDGFSRYAVRCGCFGPCPHLREALFCDFAADVAQVDYEMWNGGVFVADRDGWDLLETWHQMACASFALPYWRTRDQGVLAGAAFLRGRQDAPRLPGEYNTIVDCFEGIPEAQRSTLPAEALAIHPNHLPLPRAVAAHYINGGIGRSGWPHSDQLREGSLLF